MTINDTFIEEIITTEEKEQLVHIQKIKQFLTEKQYKKLLKKVFKNAIKRYKKGLK